MISSNVRIKTGVRERIEKNSEKSNASRPLVVREAPGSNYTQSMSAVVTTRSNLNLLNYI